MRWIEQIRWSATLNHIMLIEYECLRGGCCTDGFRTVKFTVWWGMDIAHNTSSLPNSAVQE